MTIINPNTLFVGKNYIYLEECASTNSYLLDELHSKNIAEGSLVVANHQFSGRGQMGNVWESQADENLTFSCVLMPKWLKPTEQFYITKLVSMTLVDVLNSYRDGFEIKWPNDIYFEDQKVAGILIENSVQKGELKNVVVGIGLNVNQVDFESEKAISLHGLCGEKVDKMELLEKICERLEANYLRFKRDQKVFDRGYLERLYRRGEVHEFVNQKSEIRNQKIGLMSDVGCQVFVGEIIGVSEIGKLIVKIESELNEFDMKEIRFVNNS